MSDTDTSDGTAPGSNAGNQGGGAPTDAPAVQVSKTFTQEQYDTALAKMRRAAEAEFAKKRDSEWLNKLGVGSIEDAVERLAQSAPQKSKKSDAEIQIEKVSADFTQKLEMERKARVAAEEALKASAVAREHEQLKSFLLSHVGNTTDPALAMALFGVSYKAPREIRMLDGKPTVYEDDTPLPHIKPEEWVKEVLSKPEHAYLRKPTSVGSGTRVGPSAARAPAVAPGRKLSQQEQLDAAVMAGLAHVSGANGGR